MDSGQLVSGLAASGRNEAQLLSGLVRAVERLGQPESQPGGRSGFKIKTDSEFIRMRNVFCIKIISVSDHFLLSGPFRIVSRELKNSAQFYQAHALLVDFNTYCLD